MKNRPQKRETGVSVIYVLRTPHSSLLKIGITTKTAKERAKQLSQQTSSIGEFIELWSYQIPTEFSKQIERQVHLILINQNKHVKKEYFNATEKECVAAVLRVVREIGSDQELEQVRIRNAEAKEKVAQELQEISDEIAKKKLFLNKLFESANQKLLTKLRFYIKKFDDLLEEQNSLNKKLNFFQYIFSDDTKRLHQEFNELKKNLIQLDCEYEDAKIVFKKIHKLDRVDFNNYIVSALDINRRMYDVKQYLKVNQQHWKFRNAGKFQPSSKN